MGEDVDFSWSKVTCVPFVHCDYDGFSLHKGLLSISRIKPRCLTTGCCVDELGWTEMCPVYLQVMKAEVGQ